MERQGQMGAVERVGRAGQSAGAGGQLATPVTGLGVRDVRTVRESPRKKKSALRQLLQYEGWAGSPVKRVLIAF